ncbi:MAG: NRDE family protein [Pirellulales bacterium]
MCLLVIDWKLLPEAPVLVAANREEAFDRPALPPRIVKGAISTEERSRRGDQAGSVAPRVLCGIDERAGGTWLGVNEHGLLVAVTNRRTAVRTAPLRSRGTLCQELLDSPGAEEASRRAMEELARGSYAGANFACVDFESGWVIHAGDRLERIELAPGRHLITNQDLNDPADGRLSLARRLFDQQEIGSAAEFLATAQRVCSHRVESPLSESEPASQVSIVLRTEVGGTVSSSLIALTRRPEEAVYLYAPGPPDITAYEDYSHLVKDLLAGLPGQW